MQRERGGILAAVVVGVVLVALLSGAIALSKNQGRQASTNQSVSVKTDDNATTQKQSEPQSTQHKDNSGNASDTAKPETPKAQPSTPAQPSAPQNTAPPAPKPQDSHIATTGPSDIATTGPGDVLFTTLALAALTATATAYWRSRRQMLARALR